MLYPLYQSNAPVSGPLKAFQKLAKAGGRKTAVPAFHYRRLKDFVKNVRIFIEDFIEFSNPNQHNGLRIDGFHSSPFLF